jgi:transglutaminase-like putative cysteine protease
MRIRISHLTNYAFETSAAGMIQMLRLTPRNHDGQYVARWRIDVSTDCRLDQHEDAFGNITHVFTADGPLSELAVAVEGEVETRDTQGIVRGVVERFPPSLYLRETSLTTADADVAGFAAASRDTAGGNVLNLLHLMLRQLHEHMSYDTAARHTAITAVDAFAARRGVAQDFAQIFIAAARSLGIPARYVSGYIRRDDGVRARERARLGGSVRARTRVGCFRCGERILCDGRPCASRGRARLSGRSALARDALRRRRRAPLGRDPCRPSGAADPGLRKDCRLGASIGI